MPLIQYIDEKNFREGTLAIIAKANAIAARYKAQGYNLSLRQLYYQFISEDFFPNTEQSYNKLGRIVNDARLAGMLDWNYIEDRGREAHGVGWLGNVPRTQAEIIYDSRYGYALDLWKGQERRVEVWVEKQALEEVVERAATQTRTGYFACKGYVSQSEMWTAGRRLRRAIHAGQTPLILHLGDHDPSGIDMTRDIQDRLSMFAEEPIEVRRIALTMDQIDEYAPPPNPAKVTDSRFADYEALYGSESWELDALKPQMLVELISSEILKELDVDLFDEQVMAEQEGQQKIADIADRWDEITEFLEGSD